MLCPRCTGPWVVRNAGRGAGAVDPSLLRQRPWTALDRVLGACTGGVAPMESAGCDAAEGVQGHRICSASCETGQGECLSGRSAPVRVLY